MIPSNHCINCLPDVNLLESLFDTAQTFGNTRSNCVTTAFGVQEQAKASYSRGKQTLMPTGSPREFYPQSSS